MRLIGNKRDISYDKVNNRIYWKGDDIRYCNTDIWYNQGIDIRIITQSNWLINNMHNEINR
jgi:hypothetical protein